jgi:fucose permease
MLQVGFGLNALGSGLITFASAAGAMTMRLSATPVIRRFGFRRVLIGNSVVASLFLFGYAWFSPSTPHSMIFMALLIGGFFRSLQFTAYNTLAYGDVPRSRMSSATSLYVTCQQLAATIGISAGAVSLEISMALSGHHLPQPIDFSHAFLVVATFTLIAAPIALLMPRNAGDDLTGRRSVAVEPVRRPAE